MHVTDYIVNNNAANSLKMPIIGVIGQKVYTPS